MTTYYDKDLIAERDHKAKIMNSVIKFWQVNYLDRETLMQQEKEKNITNKAINSSDVSAKDDESLKLALEVSARLQREAAEDEAIKQAEIVAALAAAENADKFNATTGSYSGAYGMNVNLDEEKLNQVDSILNEKNDYIKSLFENAN